jgi:lipoprotein-anchoring transpeptidase ErfK/SrfK
MTAINDAEWRGADASGPGLLKLQVLLDRARVSPGLIDATWGENTRKAIAAFKEMRGLDSRPGVDERVWREHTDGDAAPVVIKYTLTDKDVAGPFVEKIPKDYREKAALKRLDYTSPEELLAEKFHISEEVLRRLNPNADFRTAGAEIIVPDVRRAKPMRKVARVEVDADQQRLRAHDKDDRIVAIYPATVGSSERPSPMGEFRVTAVVDNPIYHYDPSLNLRGVDVEEKLELPPGPNNPVGLVWIDLSAKGYGIHGTPDPATVGKSASHGCIRLTNWDAKELAQVVGKGTPVIITRRQQRR